VEFFVSPFEETTRKPQRNHPSRLKDIVLNAGLKKNSEGIGSRKKAFESGKNEQHFGLI